MVSSSTQGILRTFQWQVCESSAQKGTYGTSTLKGPDGQIWANEKGQGKAPNF